MEKLLKVKQALKKRTPTFTRSDNKGKGRIARTGWRKPKGLQNKIGDNKKGFKKMPNTGYRTPKALRNTNKAGLQLVLVHNKTEAESLDKSKHVAIVSSIGMRKKIALLDILQKAGVEVQGIKDIPKYIETAKANASTAQKAKAAKQKERKDKKAKKAKVKSEKDLAKAVKQAQKEEAKKSEKTDAKKELDKVLTKKE